MEKAIVKVLPVNAFKTATTDRGKKFARFQFIQGKAGHENFIQRKLILLESMKMNLLTTFF
jgi:hypothetical protein